MMRNESDRVQKLLVRIRTRRRLRAVMHHSGTAVAAAIFSVALFNFLERIISISVSDQIFYGVPVALLLAGGVLAFLSVRSVPVVEAVEAERQGAIPQTISTSLLARDSGFSTEAADKIIGDAQVLAANVDPRRAVPLGKPGHGRRVLYSLAVLILSLVIPAVDLLGIEEEATKKQRESHRIARKESSLQRRLREVSRLAERHQIDAETRKLLTRLAQKPEVPPASELSNERHELTKSAQDRARIARRVVSSRLERDALASARTTAERVRRSAEQSGEPKSKEGRELQRAMRKGDLGRAAMELQKLARAAGKDGEAGKQAREDLARIASSMGLSDDLANKLAQASGAGKSGDQIDPKDLQNLTRQLEQLARLLRESDLLDHALDQIKFTEAELSSLPSEWPEGPPPQICPDCLAGT
ncbi:MAG: hypothetical protein AAEJ65_05130 [Planctomycetota bacterium]